MVFRALWIIQGEHVTRAFTQPRLCKSRLWLQELIMNTGWQGILPQAEDRRLSPKCPALPDHERLCRGRGEAAWRRHLG